MNENTTHADAMLELDTSSIKERAGSTTSSLTDINQIPVFSDSFEESVEEKAAREKEWNEIILNQVFGEKSEDITGEDVRSRMFLQTDAEWIVRNDAAADAVSSLLQISGGLIAAGIMIAGMIWLYGRKGKRKPNVDNQYETYTGKTKS